MVGNIYGKNFKDEIYKNCLPHKYKDTLPLSVLQSQDVKKNVWFHKVTDKFNINGQSLEFFLLNEMNNGIIIATSQLYCPHKYKEYEYHVFVYNSYFTQADYPNIYGGITDNRINYNYIGLEKRTHYPITHVTTL